MTKFGLLGAAAVMLSSALASPVMAQQVIYNPGYCAQFYPNANCQNKGPGNPYTGRLSAPDRLSCIGDGETAGTITAGTARPIPASGPAMSRPAW